ncbi:MAG: response regulator [Desulfotalea sp.]
MSDTNEYREELERLRQENDLLRRAEDKNVVLSKIINSVTTTFNLDELFASIHNALSEVMDVTNFYIATYSKETDILSFPFHVDTIGDPYEDIPNVSEMKTSLTGKILSSGEPMLLLKKDVEKIIEDGGGTGYGTVAETWIGAPLKHDNNVFGAIVAQSYDSRVCYSLKDVDFLNSVSDQIAIAIMRKVGEESLLKSESKYRNLVENIIDVVFSTDGAGEFKYVSPSIRKISDYYPDEIIENWHRYDLSGEAITHAYNNIVHIDDRQDVEQAIESAASSSMGSYDIDYRLMKKNGKYKWVNEKGFVFSNDDSTQHIEGVIYDIDDQRYAEDINHTLFEISTAVNSSETLQDLYFAIHSALSRIIDVENFHIALYDKQRDLITFDFLQNSVDHPGGNFVIENASSSHTLTSRIIFSGELINANKEEMLEYYKQINKKPSGTSSEYWLGVPLKINTQVIGAMVTQSYTDATFYENREAETFSRVSDQVAIAIDRKHAEEELKIAKEVAEASAESKSEFLANMSHEIRTPMNAVMGLTDLALKTELTIRQKDYLHKIKSASTSLLGIINDILDVSKIDAGKLQVERIGFKLSDVMDSLSDMFSTKTAEKEIEFVCSLSNDLPVNLIGDPLRLRQILINLTGNAIKFTQDGEIIVGVSLLVRDGDFVTFEFAVTDTGIGIPEDRLATLFDSFVQADGSTTRKYGGTGLGLSISKKLITLMGGDISLESVLGEGSRFSFRLQFEVNKQKNIDRIPVGVEIEGLKVLVVDDNRAAREIMYETLSSFHIAVQTVGSGMEGYDQLVAASKTEDPYKLVILDLRMPEIDGIETAKLIRDSEHVFDIPIIMMTAFGREEIMQQAKKAGVNSFLMKPVKQSILLDTIMDVFGKETAISFVDTEGRTDTKIDLTGLQGMNVLLAEDNEINQQVAMEVLADVGVIVTIAGTGLEAVNLLQEQSYDAVLMDIQMPVMDGYEATGEIRNTLGMTELPIIAMTAHAMVGDREKCLKAGMDDYIAKPIDAKVLFSKLLNVSFNNNGHQPLVTSKANVPEKKVKFNISLPDNLPGIDIKAAIIRLRGNTELFVKLLTSFNMDFSDAVYKLKALLKSDDVEAAMDYLHTIKGIAGNFSATRLQASTAELELSLKEQGQVDNGLMHAFNEVLFEVAESFAVINDLYITAKNKVGEAEASAFDIPEISEKLNFLHSKILDNDLDVIEVFETVGKMLKSKVAKEEIALLGKAINSFEFDEAEIVLFRIKKKLNIS